MSSSNELPEFEGIGTSLLGKKGQGNLPGSIIPLTNADKEASIPYGEELTNSLINSFRNGLPQNVKDEFLRKGKGQIGSNLGQATQNFRETIAGAGSGIPIDAILKGQNQLQTSANSEIAGLNDSLLEKDQQAKQNSYQQLMQLFGLASGSSGQQNQYNLNKYQIDESNRFKIGDFLGALLQGAGNVAGGALGGG